MAEDREIAGIRCKQVLGKLDDYVADELSGTARKQVEAHLSGCDWCTKFGGEYASLVSTLRNGLVQFDEPVGRDARELAERLLRSTDQTEP